MPLKYTILVLVFLAQNYNTVFASSLADPPLDIFYEAPGSPGFTKAVNPLRTRLAKLSMLATELLNMTLSNGIAPIAVATEPGVSKGGSGRFYVVVYKIRSEHLTMAVLTTDDKDDVSVLDYYLGFDIGGIIIHKIYSMAMQKITTKEDPNQRKTYHSWLSSLVFQGYQAATEKWEQVRYKPMGMDVGIRDAYIKVKNDCAAAADVLVKKYTNLEGLPDSIRNDFADADESKTLDQNKMNKVDHQAFTILQYMRQEVETILSGKTVKAMHTGFILQIKGASECVLGVTIYNGEIFTEFSLPGNQEGSSNPYNVFLLKCQALAISFRKNPNQLHEIWREKTKRGIFGPNPYLQGSLLAKFGLTYTPWKTSVNWTGFECGFFHESITVVDNEVGNVHDILSDEEKKYVYSRCNSKYDDTTWSDIKRLPTQIESPVSNPNAPANDRREQTTWVEKQNLFLDELVNGKRRRDRDEWKGLHIVKWVDSLQVAYPLYPLGTLYDSNDPPLWFSGPNPVVDIVINIPVKDREGKYVLTSDGTLRWNTVTGRRGRPPFARQLHGGYVEVNKEIEEILAWILEIHGAVIQKILFDDICLLNAIKEFLEESKGILSLPLDQKKAMWVTFVRLVFVENLNQEKVKYRKIFEGPNGDKRNQQKSYGYAVAYAFFVIHSPELEEFLDEKKLIGGDDNVESAIVTLSNGMSCFATHELFILRTLRQRPTRADVIKSLEEISKSDKSVILANNLNRLKKFL